MTDEQILELARKKLNNVYPEQLPCVWFKGLRIDRDMFEGEE